MRVDVRHVSTGVVLDIDRRTVRWEGDVGGAAGDMAICTALLPAMARGEARLEIAEPVSPVLLDKAATLQDIFRAWLPGARRTHIDATPGPVWSARGKETLCFFSGGVDSFHTVVTSRDQIDRLVFVEGFDVQSCQVRLLGRVRSSLEAAAGQLGLPLTVLRTDVRDWSGGLVGWEMYHGAGLATAAHLLADSVERAFIPASAPYGRLYPWGSHPLTDPLWSGSVKIEHRGAGADRIEKVAALVDEPAAWRTLRVCWRNPEQAYNCGECEKCLRTMTTLEAYGALDRFNTFPDKLSASRVATLRLRGEASQRNAEANIGLLVERSIRPDLQQAWRRALRGPSLRQRAWYRTRRTTVRILSSSTTAKGQQAPRE